MPVMPSVGGDLPPALPPPPPVPPSPAISSSPSVNPSPPMPSFPLVSLPLALALSGVISSHSLKPLSPVTPSDDVASSSFSHAPQDGVSGSALEVLPQAGGSEVFSANGPSMEQHKASSSSAPKVAVVAGVPLPPLKGNPKTVKESQPVSSASKDKSIQIEPNTSKSILPNPQSKHQKEGTSQTTKPAPQIGSRPRNQKINVPLPEVNVASRQWASLFTTVESKSQHTTIEYYPPEMDCSQKFAVLEEEEVFEAQKAWGFILVGYVWGKSPVYIPFLQFIRRLWNPKGEITLTLQGNGFFMVKFSLEEDLLKVLEGGPWTMDNRPFVIQKWARNTKLELKRLTSIPIWIKFPNLPLHFWSRTCIGKIASLIGTPLYMDTPTATRSRTAFARVCVEFTAGDDLPDEVFVQIQNGDRQAVRVTYDWKPEACSHCNTFGHDAALCCKKPRLIPSPTQEGSANDGSFVEASYKKKGSKQHDSSEENLASKQQLTPYSSQNPSKSIQGEKQPPKSIQGEKQPPKSIQGEKQSIQEAKQSVQGKKQSYPEVNIPKNIPEERQGSIASEGQNSKEVVVSLVTAVESSICN
ncbi:hypothetical protein QJS10_CPA06g01306 [Acorus calamus]|uniref:DUF4283 domain-containing protein n=1 Tax=Acorus calamus TaxID=4465 RepID=A0AAV9EIY3_ACOCL|nr:hypothetical protein QJS10_CPA06g01306 [Acorus calamus]